MMHKIKDDKINKNSGITLIALIIMIIVLLILSGIAITTLTGDSGILNKANLSKEETRGTNVEKAVRLWEIDNHSNNKTSNTATKTVEELVEELVAQDLLTEEEKKQILGEPSKGIEGTYQIQIGSKTIAFAEDKMKVDTYGQYVNYSVDLNNDGDTTNDWKIFYSDSEHVFLISADYAANTNEKLSTALKEAGMTKTTGRNYCAYWETTKIPNFNCSTDGNDVCLFPQLFKTTGYSIENNKGKANSRCAGALLCTKNWESLVDNEYADYAIGGPTIEMWISSWNKHSGNYDKLYCNNTDENGYFVGNKNKPTSTSVNMQSSSGSEEEREGYYDELYFPHRTQYLNGTGAGNSAYISHSYWFASPSAGSNESLIIATYKGSIAESWKAYDEQSKEKKGYEYTSASLRPIVCLKSRVELVKNGDKTYYDIK